MLETNQIKCMKPVFLITLPHLLTFREWVSKVDHMRSCVPENQEAWKEGSEEHGSSKTAWADSVDSRMASTGIVTQYNKSLASKVYQVTLVRTTPNYLYASIVWKRL